MLMQKGPGSREAAPRRRRAPRPGRAPGTEVDVESGDESEPPLEEPARLCREAAGGRLLRAKLPPCDPPLPAPSPPPTSRIWVLGRLLF